MTLIAARACPPLLTARLSLRLAFLLFGRSLRVAPSPALSRLVAFLSPNLAFRRLAARAAPRRLAPPRTSTFPVAVTTQSSEQLTAIAIGLPALGFPFRESFTRGGWVSTVKLREAGVGSGLAGEARAA